MTIIERLQASGIRRIGTLERGFRYFGPRRRSVSAPDRERIESLVIPPAWKEVAINPSPGGAVQAIGKDSQRQRLCALDGFLSRLTIGQDSGKLEYLRQPTAVVLKFDFNREGHDCLSSRERNGLSRCRHSTMIS